MYALITAGLASTSACGPLASTVPQRYEMSIVLIEHDLDLVRTVCSTLTVLDFGTVLASGPQAEVLANSTPSKT